MKIVLLSIDRSLMNHDTNLISDCMKLQTILDELKRPVQQKEEVYHAYSDDDSDEWMGCEAAFAFSGGRSESVYFY
jgi:hypothetical protein